MSLTISINEENRTLQVNDTLLIPMSYTNTLSNDINKYIITIGKIYIKPSNINIINANNINLSLIIPVGTISGTLFVSYIDGAISNVIKSNTINITIDYAEETFDQNQQYTKPIQSGVSNKLPVSHKPIYNKDIAYTGYTEVYDENSLIQNLCTLILTRKGERLFNPDYGTSIQDKVFSLYSDPDLLRNEILKHIIQRVEIYETRIIIDANQSDVILDDSSNSIILLLSVILPKGIVTEIGLTLSIPRMEV